MKKNGTTSNAVHEKYMLTALKLAWQVKGETFPNPAVGAVVVAGNTVVGQGATQRAGGMHAEKVALKKAGKKAAGATLYVTLEPCSHFGRTAPCTHAIIRAGVAQVVAAVRDPNPLVAGKGIARLRAAGIKVKLGVLRVQAARLNEEFFHAIAHRRAWITLKLGLTLDGRIADAQGGSQWITGDESLTYVHGLRRTHAAVAVGRNTLVKDDPRLTVRRVRGRSPARIVFSSTRKLPARSYFVRNSRTTRSIVVLPGETRQKIAVDARTGIEYWHTGKKAGRAHLLAFTRMAYENDMTSVLVEGGSKLASAFLGHGLVNRIYLLYGNKIFGQGLCGIAMATGRPITSSIALEQQYAFMLGDTVIVTGKPHVPG
ncbi:MAG: bifunctional diaminohydroxyphosphoribosylaminopyrimidine deaminase/5-amino-6-(5-phosphoribosylamino)uracil reductase RibD [Chitinispirillaceae bacterium]|nr:bifunctional diaminohydroxyphosphoribosylaminopyrimidine deaminase/5-amino-6-(5-phosphoribosylamino)uracil reductase RibD [Chitinispirillaceae bacterium]